MKINILVIVFVFVFITGCETPGDKFPRFEVKETMLGKIKDHMIKKACFINEQVGFVAISKDTLMKTTDGCKTFTRALTDSSSVFEGIQFITENTGFVIDRNNFVYKTMDGGESWEKISIGISGAWLRDIKCLNQDTLFVAAGGDPQVKDGYIIKSTDGGKTWDSTRTKNLSHICFINDLTGFACGYDGIIKTTDTGKTWDTISTLSSEEIVFIDENNGFFCDKRSLFNTVDGGRNWKLVKAIVNPSWIIGKDFSKIECLNLINNRDLIFTLNSRLIKVRADKKWLQYEFTRPYYQLQMINMNKGIVYGFETLILVDF
jgi:photosystem II stability/assembly factor-like uncharacterized protein